MIVIGIDPDANKHGVSVYVDSKLVDLKSLELMQLVDLLREYEFKCVVHIEDVNAQKAVWHGRQQSKAAYGMTSQNVAKCKQAQLEVERMCKYFGVEVVKHKISSEWKSQAGKVVFERVTGWKGRSNEDARSAAWFGYKGVQLQKIFCK